MESLAVQLNGVETSSLHERSLASAPCGAREVIQQFPESAFGEAGCFTAAHNSNDQAAINMFQVVGTRHPDYARMSWLDLVRYGKGMKTNLALHGTNRGYYLGADRKLPTMSYTSVEGFK